MPPRLAAVSVVMWCKAALLYGQLASSPSPLWEFRRNWLTHSFHLNSDVWPRPPCRRLRGRWLQGRRLRGRWLRGRWLQGRRLRGRRLQGRLPNELQVACWHSAIEQQQHAADCCAENMSDSEDTVMWHTWWKEKLLLPDGGVWAGRLHNLQADRVNGVWRRNCRTDWKADLNVPAVPTEISEALCLFGDGVPTRKSFGNLNDRNMQGFDSVRFS